MGLIPEFDDMDSSQCSQFNIPKCWDTGWTRSASLQSIHEFANLRRGLTRINPQLCYALLKVVDVREQVPGLDLHLVELPLQL